MNSATTGLKATHNRKAKSNQPGLDGLLFRTTQCTRNVYRTYAGALSHTTQWDTIRTIEVSTDGGLTFDRFYGPVA